MEQKKEKFADVNKTLKEYLNTFSIYVLHL